MFLFYRLFHRCIGSTPSSSASDYPTGSSSSLDPAKNPALLVWWVAFGVSLAFRLAAELVTRILFFSFCALLVGVLDGALNLLVGHAVLRAVTHDGYNPPFPSSIEAGALGGLAVIGPSTLATVCLIALLGGLKLQRVLSRHVMLFLELASAVSASAAAASAGIAIVRRMHPQSALLDTTHAARAAALGACLLTAPILSAVTVFTMRETQAAPFARTELDQGTSTPLTLSPLVASPVTYDMSSPRTYPRPRVIAHRAAETVGYVIVTLCILSIRLLCF